MSRLYSLADVTTEELDRIRRGEVSQTGLPSGIGLEGLVPGGIPRKKVTAVFADEGTFKTTFVAQMIYAMSMAGYNVLNVTLEDSAQLVAHRYLARKTGVSYGRIHGGVLTPEETELVLAAKVSPDAKHVYIVDDIEPRWERVVAGCEAVPGCDALIVDYLQMFGRDPTILDNIVFSAQRYAKVKNIAIILVSQRVKIEKDDPNPRPKTSDMFGSSAMRMGVKLAVGLFRPSAYCPTPTNAKGPYGAYCRFVSANPAHAEIYPNIIEVHVTKNLLGPGGALWCRVTPETGVIEPFNMLEYV